MTRFSNLQEPGHRIIECAKAPVPDYLRALLRCPRARPAAEEG